MRLLVMRATFSISDRWDDLCRWVGNRRTDVAFRASRWVSEAQTPAWMIATRRVARAMRTFAAWRWELWRARRVDPVLEWLLVLAAHGAEALHRAASLVFARARPSLERFSSWAMGKAESLRQRRSEILWRWRSFAAHRIEPVVYALEDRLQSGPGPLRDLLMSDLVPGKRAFFALVLTAVLFVLSWWNARPAPTPEATPAEIALLRAFVVGASVNPNADITDVTPRSLERK